MVTLVYGEAISGKSLVANGLKEMLVANGIVTHVYEMNERGQFPEYTRLVEERRAERSMIFVTSCPRIARAKLTQMGIQVDQEIRVERNWVEL